MGKRKDEILPKPICDHNNTSCKEDSGLQRAMRGGKTALWMTVAVGIFIYSCWREIKAKIFERRT